MAMDAKYTDVETFLHDMETEKLVSEMKRYVQHGRNIVSALYGSALE